MLEGEESSRQSTETCRAVKIVCMILYMSLLIFPSPGMYKVNGEFQGKIWTLEDYGVSK